MLRRDFTVTGPSLKAQNYPTGNTCGGGVSFVARSPDTVSFRLSLQDTDGFD